MIQRIKAFTLIEMLIVVAIIGILASMLAPSLMKAVDSAKLVSCASNMKQIGFALNSYAEDYKGFVFLSDDSYWYDNWNKNQKNEGFLHRIGPLSGYITNGKIYDCPGNGVSNDPKRIKQGWGGYGTRGRWQKYEYPNNWSGTGYYKRATLVRKKLHVFNDKYKWENKPSHNGGEYNIFFPDMHLNVYHDPALELIFEGNAPNWHTAKCNELKDSAW